jgi:signal transduction histidine kinase
MLESGKPLTVRDMAEDPNSPYHGTVKAAGLRGFLGAPMFSKDKKPLGLLFVTTRQPRDFTQREVALIEQFARGIAIAIENAGLFEEARKKSHELEDAYRAKSDFLNTMSHELRTPLNVIIGGEQLLADGFFGNLTEEQAKGLEPVGRNARDLLRLINGILDLARLEARRVPLCVEEFALRGLMDELESSFAALAREKGLGLKFEEANGIRLRSDRAKVKDILQNLIGNAVKYTDRGEVRISGGEKNGGAMLSVRDTGIGIRADELGKVFEPFYMVEGVDREKYPGSGLGLSIVKRTVELLGGSIAVESEFGSGSAFTVTLPDLPAPPEPKD